MPYTLSHPAAILPIWHLSRKRLRLAALAIGAASPDFFFLLTGHSLGRFSHTLPGLVVMCLPFSWLALIIFDRWGRAGVQALLPTSWCLPPPPTPLRPFMGTTVAILVGALSHVVWDSFTHRSGWGVSALPILSMPLLIDVFPSLRLYRVLQHISTVVGLAVLAWPCWRWMWAQPKVELNEIVKRGLLYGGFLAAGGVLYGLRFAHRGFSYFMIGGGVGVILSLTLAVLVLGWRQARVSVRSR